MISRRKLLIGLLATAALLTGLFTLSQTAFAASASDLEFELNGTLDGYEVVSCRSSASGELVIPATHNGLPVTDIGADAFRHCSSLTSVTIPHSVIRIGGVFAGCNSLERIIYCGNQEIWNSFSAGDLGNATVQFHDYVDGVCALCQITKCEALGHNMKESAAAIDPTCEEPGKTAVLTCANGCGKTEGGETIPTNGHVWEAAGNGAARRCKVCGKYEEMFCLHIWSEATCIEPETCYFCGIPRGEIDPNGHAWCAASCSTPETCELCGKTNAEALGHNMQQSAAAVEPTCTAAGKTEVLACANGCGKTEGGETIPAKGHVFEGDTCTVCGQGKFVAGDGNGDGKVNLKDAILALQTANGKETSVDRGTADVNGDGKVNLKDAILILKRANGNKDPFPAEK